MKPSREIVIFLLGWFWVSIMGAEGLWAQTAQEKSTWKDVKQETSEAYQSVKNFSVKQKDEAVRKSK